jgi:hypothetical protein
MSIRVGKKWDVGAQYIGRGSPLGNPFAMKDKSDEERNRVCDLYEVWIRERIEAEDMNVIKELRRLHAIHVNGVLVLGCFCSPKRCHGDYIKTILEFHDKK